MRKALYKKISELELGVKKGEAAAAERDSLREELRATAEKLKQERIDGVREKDPEDTEDVRPERSIGHPGDSPRSEKGHR